MDSPFVGLKAMTEADADRFFGRNDEIVELGAKLKRHRLIADDGGSGAGKSSLAQAGHIPVSPGGALLILLAWPDPRLRSGRHGYPPGSRPGTKDVASPGSC